MEESNPWLAATLRARVGESTDPARIADALVSILLEVEAALAPVLGSRGVALIYLRSLQRSPSLQPLVAAALDEAQEIPTSLDLQALRSMLAQRSGADVIVTGTDLLQTLYDLLVNVVGLSMTERLLRSVWTNASSGVPAPDSST